MSCSSLSVQISIIFLTFKDLNGQNSSKILIPYSKYSKESKACGDYADRSMRIGWRKLVFLGQTHHGCADVPQLLGYSVIHGLRRRHFGGAVAAWCKEMKSWKKKKSSQSESETSKSPSGRDSCALTCSKGRSPRRRSPPRRSRWWSELPLWGFSSSTWWAQTSSSSKKVTWGKSGGLALCEWPQGADCRPLRRCLMGGTRIKRNNNYTTEITEYYNLISMSCWIRHYQINTGIVSSVSWGCTKVEVNNNFKLHFLFKERKKSWLSLLLRWLAAQI